MFKSDEISKETLYHEYIELNKNRYKISEEYNISPTKIGILLQKFGIRRKSVSRHGLCKHPLNIIWCGMNERCNNPNNANYKWYGGKGIKVCDEWKKFINFYSWAIANGWEKGYSLDRIDGSKNYSPDNCRWITHKEQCRNRSTNVSLKVNDKTMLLCEWEEYLGLKKKTIARWKHRHGEEYVIEKIKGLMQNAS